jgi:MFS family permease
MSVEAATAPEPTTSVESTPVDVPVADRAGRTRPAILRPLAFRDFRLVWLGQAVSLLGDQFHFVALAWLVLDLTGSGLALGLVLMAASIPRAILLLVGGALADRIAPRRLMLVSDVARGVAVGVLAGLVLTSRAELWHLVVMAIVFGIADALFFPSMNAIVPALVPTDRLAPANALVQGTTQLMNLVGPVLAGLLVVAVGTGAAFAVDAASFAFAALTLTLVRTGRPAATPQETSDAMTDDTPAVEGSGGLLSDIRVGLAYAFRDPAIRTLVVLSAVFNFAINGPIAVGLPWLADQRFAADASVFGLMIAGFGLGAVIGAIVAGSIARPRRQGTLLLSIAAGIGVGMAAIGLAPDPLVVLVVLTVMGLGIGYINVVVIAWLGGHIVPEMRGRVMGLVMLASFGLGPMSLALSGALIDIAATALFLAAGGLVTIVALGALASGARRALDLDPLTGGLT